MKSAKMLQWVGVALGSCLALYLIYSHLQYFGNVSFLGAILMLEIIIACLWKYDERFLVLLMIMFVWAGLGVPLRSAAIVGRWIVLGTGAAVGFIIWTKTPRRPFRSIHLIAFFCISAAFVSATVSPFIQMASLKALSLSLLFLYCVSGARLSLLEREPNFFRGVVLATEIAVFVTAICYLGLGNNIWGNPNSLGAAMSIGVFPILLWAWLISDGLVVRLRRLVALLLSGYLVHFSMARAGIIAVGLVTVFFCVGLRQYRLLVKVVALVLVVVALSGMFAPEALTQQLGEFEDALLYKGHKEEGLLGSRRTPWDQSISSIKQHPLFGTGYGTSPTGEDPGMEFGKFYSTAETEREHGSSYMTIAEWVGLLGVLPFVALLALTISSVWKVGAWMRRTADPTHYSIPIAMVVLAGLIHASFEDWLFAVGSYLCLFFWVFAFLLADLVPDAVTVPVTGVLPRVSHPMPADYGAVVSTR
jgi:O-antigen ligase